MCTSVATRKTRNLVFIRGLKKKQKKHTLKTQKICFSILYIYEKAFKWFWQYLFKFTLWI